MKKIKQNIRTVLFIAMVLSLTGSCAIENPRIAIQGIKLGDNINTNKFIVIKDYKELDFPYKEVVLKCDSNIVLRVVGENNTIFEMKRINLSNNERKVLITSINNKMHLEPDSSINVFSANIWHCNMYIWKDLQSFDIITLSSCVHKNNVSNLGVKWELTIINDTIRNSLDENYNPFH